MNKPLLSKQTYFLLFALLGVVYIIGLFVPLMDNDSAHHGLIALHMHLTGDYVNLIDYGADYLDKPHLHFWLCSLSYKIFGVTTFAYKFPSFLFTIGGVYSVYRLGRVLYDNETGKLAALIIASAFAFILANNDVRMDALLAAFVAFATWQGVEFINEKRLINAVGFALGLALGFSTKGMIGVLVPAVGLFFYIVWKKDWPVFYNWKWMVVLFCFGLFISPVLYCFYLQYNLHPEKIVREQSNINGINFILLGQTFDRLGNKMDANPINKDYSFFFHTFLWAFAPWAFTGYWAIGQRIKNFIKRDNEWLTPATIIIYAVIIGVSGFKLPHYLNIVFPAAAVLIASWIIKKGTYSKPVFYIQLFTSVVLLLLAAGINFWAFPVKNYWVVAGMIMSLAFYFHFIRSKIFLPVQKAVCITASASVVFYFLYNSSFSPQLLKYQGGNELAKKIRGAINPEEIYFLKDNYSSSFNFYTATLRKEFKDSVFINRHTIWVLFNENSRAELEKNKLLVVKEIEVPDYEITRYSFKFYNPVTRDNACTRMILAEVTRNQ